MLTEKLGAPVVAPWLSSTALGPFSYNCSTAGGSSSGEGIRKLVGQSGPGCVRAWRPELSLGLDVSFLSDGSVVSFSACTLSECCCCCCCGRVVKSNNFPKPTAQFILQCIAVVMMIIL